MTSDRHATADRHAKPTPPQAAYKYPRALNELASALTQLLFIEGFSYMLYETILDALEENAYLKVSRDFADTAFREFHSATNPIGAIVTHQLMPGYSHSFVPSARIDVIAYVLRGTLNVVGSRLGDVPVIEGSALRISERPNCRLALENQSSSETVKFIQLMIKPDRRKFSANFQMRYLDDQKEKQLRLIASGYGRHRSITLHNDVSIYSAVLHEDDIVRHQLRPGRMAWLHVAKGSAEVNGTRLSPSSSVSVASKSIELVGQSSDTEVLLLDVKASAA